MDNSKVVQFLKRLAVMGALDNSISVSSTELGRELGISQQSASNWILELVNEGYIDRRLGARRQHIKLTEKGTETLKKEYSDYRHIFDSSGKMTITGAVTTGFGEGGYYINQEGYMEQFKEKLGFVPFQGTLNLRLSPKEVSTIELLRHSKGIEIDGFTEGGRTFGPVKCFMANIGNLQCAVVMPKRSHYREVIEVICKVHIRRTLSLKDGDGVKLTVALDQKRA
jgi:riboflavin kinase